MVESLINTSKADVLLYFDDDDPTAPRVGTWGGPRIHVERGPRIGRGAGINHLCQRFPEYDGYLLVADDVRFIRRGWDLEVSEAMGSFPDGIGLVHLSTGIPEGWVNWPCVSRKWLDATGWFHYPRLERYCQDTVLQALGQALGRIRYIEPVVLEHDCVTDGTGADCYSKDVEAFLWFMARDFGNTLTRLREAV